MKRIAVLLFSLVFLLASCRGLDIDGKDRLPKENDEHDESSGDDDGSGVTNIRTQQLDVLMAEEGELISAMSPDIIHCFIEKDKEALKALFCEQVRNQPGFDEEIDRAFEYFQGDIYIDAQIETSASGGESYRDGVRTDWDVSPDIPFIDVLYYVETDEGQDTEPRSYGMSYYWHIICDEDTSLEGLQYIRIELLDVDSIKLGEYIG